MLMYLDLNVLSLVSEDLMPDTMNPDDQPLN